MVLKALDEKFIWINIFEDFASWDLALEKYEGVQGLKVGILVWLLYMIVRKLVWMGSLGWIAF